MLRGRALEWLQTDLEACGELLSKEPRRARAGLARTLQHWLHDSDLASVRGEKALEQLPEGERSEWRKLWQEVEALRRKTASSPVK